MAKNFIPYTDAEQRIAKRVIEKRDKAEQRYPLMFGMLITFGFVSTLYGFEKLIDRVDLFVNNPWILLATGVTTLVVTGAAYTKLH